MLVVSATGFLACLSWIAPALTAPIVERDSPCSKASSFSDLAVRKVLHDASPIFGVYEKVTTNTSEWMKRYADSTKLVHMNIPGTHDSATWNYSSATQDALRHVTDLDGVPVNMPERYRCQERPFIDMLNDGIRVFDLRFAFDATNTTLTFYHSVALQSETATVEDILFGFYQWLDDHQSEAVLLSLQYEGGTKLYASNDAAVQLSIYKILTSEHAQKYFVQTQDELRTLGEARGKITLLRRFDLDQLPSSFSDALPGLHFSPALWTDNSPEISLTYNPAKNFTAYIEDYYNIGSPTGSGAALNIQWKFSATTAHLTKAAQKHPDSLFWSFASSEHDSDTPVEYPKIMALGNGTKDTPWGGVNPRLLPFLREQRGKRLGIIMFDFYDQPSDLVRTLLDV
ncbi:MAG: hypothetical protein M1818_007000 [Claussenomyces sp. TS43310]|nr:MAG: hypothetical protein M1818_007000 [Claussenomyces sp. TS43310]